MHEKSIANVSGYCAVILCFVYMRRAGNEKELIKQVIQSTSVDGLCNNTDEEAVKNGFHPGFNLLRAGKGNTMSKLPIYSWIEIVKEGKGKGNTYKCAFHILHHKKRINNIDNDGDLDLVYATNKIKNDLVLLKNTTKYNL